jgi:FKBP-type peptidyl-prolyl cis-trans isomerase 2
MVRPLVKEQSAISDWIVLLALVVAVAVVLGVYYVVFAPKPAPPVEMASQGDQVNVDYIGYFQNDNLVFDTSLYRVAVDNVSYPKAFSFAWRSNWTNLEFTIGDGTVVTGFDQGVRGLSVGQEKTIVVPASLGYGAGDPRKIFHPLIETIPVRATMNESAFTEYYKQTAVSDTNVSDPVYGWSVAVSILNGFVNVTNSPYPSEVIHPYKAWTAVVLSVDDAANNGTGLITIQNQLDPSQVDRVGGTDPSGQTFYLSAVDPVGGTYTLNFNKQVVGRTLVFQVTLVSLSSLY